jgi:Na+/phosphate symporter
VTHAYQAYHTRPVRDHCCIGRPAGLAIFLMGLEFLAAALAGEIKASETVRVLMSQLHATLKTALQDAVSAIANNDQARAQSVLVLKHEIKQTINSALRHQATSNLPRDDARLAGFRIEMEILDKLERIYRLCRRIARAAMPIELLAEKTDREY